ncbi:MAG: metallophosphoesterase family protein [Vicinamibacterales bacterium]
MPPRPLASFRSFEKFASAPPREAVALETPGGTAADQAELNARVSAALAALEAEQHGRAEGVITAVPEQVASLMQSYLLEHPPPVPPRGEPIARDPSVDVLEVRYDERDILGWIGSFLTFWRGIRDEPWQPPPDAPETIGNGSALRVALLSDWGTGLYGAPECAKSIRKDSAGYGLVLHLGDVYYSGTQEEAREQFLKFWPRPAGATSRALNANHEMYTGGEGYFRVILKDFKQRSSCCAIQTDNWLLIGLDSAYKDHDLTDDQPAWVDRLIARAGTRRVILFSHHQPFSLLDSQGPKLVAKLSQQLAAGRVFAWYWGHEHRCVLYDRHLGWGLHGRCIGHGGYPHFRDKLSHLPQGPKAGWRRHAPKNLVPGGLILDARNDYIKGEEEKYGANGYVTLEFNGSRLTELVHAPDGKVLLQNDLA